MPGRNTSIKNISDLLSEKRGFWRSIEDEQWARWQRQNRNKPKFPQALSNLSDGELKKIFDPVSPRKLVVGAKPEPEINIQAIMSRYEKELEEIQLPEPKEFHQELKDNDIELR
tara:strand:+ start:427 stop:768 length:342 start_codon:yes stop_codon:yes gene_type:complete